MISLAEGLPAEIKRIQAKREEWLEYQKQAEGGPHGGAMSFAPGLAIMQMEIDEGVAALASGDVVRMLRAYEVLKGNDAD